jgi:phospholipase C
MDANDAKGRFVSMGDFGTKLAQPGFSEQFIFIEPQYGSHKFDVTGPGDFSGGNSMHPLDDVRKGEVLVKQVYEAIRAVPAVWENSALLIVFDEHGGFYDHVDPPATTPPGDDPVNATASVRPASRLCLCRAYEGVKSGCHGRRKGSLEKGILGDSDAEGCGAFYDQGEIEGWIRGVCAVGDSRRKARG